MPNEERVWAVLFTNAGLSELGEELKLYLGKGQIGLYLLCKQVDMSHPYFRMVADYHNPDGSSFQYLRQL